MVLRLDDWLEKAARLATVIFLMCVFALSSFAKELKLDIPFLIGDEVKISVTETGVVIGIFLYLDTEPIYTVMNQKWPYRVGQIEQKTLIAVQKEVEKKEKEPRLENL